MKIVKLKKKNSMKSQIRKYIMQVSALKIMKYILFLVRGILPPSPAEADGTTTTMIRLKFSKIINLVRSGW